MSGLCYIAGQLMGCNIYVHITFTKLKTTAMKVLNRQQIRNVDRHDVLIVFVMYVLTFKMNNSYQQNYN